VNIQTNKESELTDNEFAGAGVMAAGYLIGRQIAPYYLHPAICLLNLELSYLLANIIGSFGASYFYRSFE
jgi:hypothetical protein